MHIRNDELVEETRTRTERYTVYVPSVATPRETNHE